MPKLLEVKSNEQNVRKYQSTDCIYDVDTYNKKKNLLHD